MKIKILVKTLNSVNIIYMNDKKRDYLLVNRERKDYDLDLFKFKVGDMVLDWENEMVNNDILDGLEYSIVIKNKDEEKKYWFKNKFPKDIFRLELLINEVMGENEYDRNEL